MASKKTSEENVLTKSGFTANTAMRLADGSTNDNYQIGCLDFINAITLTSAQAVTLLGTPSDVVLDSLYKITTLGITGVDHVVISGRNMIQGNSSAECLVTGIGYVLCTYDVATNKINITLETIFRVTQTSNLTPVISVVTNELTGVTFAPAYADPGKYAITPSIALSSDNAGPFNEVFVHMTGTQVDTSDVANPIKFIGGYYDEVNDAIRLTSQELSGGAFTPTDVIFNESIVYLICVLSN